VGGIAVIAMLLASVMFCLRRANRRRQERTMHFGMARNTSVDEQTLISFPYGDPNRRPSGIHKISEMHTSLNWVSELPPKHSARHELDEPAQELPTIITPRIPQNERGTVLTQPEATLQPPPRSPDRDLYARYPTPTTVASESVSSLQPLRPLRYQPPSPQYASWNSRRQQRGSATSAGSKRSVARTSSTASSNTSREPPVSPTSTGREREGRYRSRDDTNASLSPISPTLSMREHQPRWI
jgi:hypothetical protein